MIKDILNTRQGTEVILVNWTRETEMSSKRVEAVKATIESHVRLLELTAMAGKPVNESELLLWKQRWNDIKDHDGYGVNLFRLEELCREVENEVREKYDPDGTLTIGKLDEIIREQDQSLNDAVEEVRRVFGSEPRRE